MISLLLFLTIFPTVTHGLTKWHFSGYLGCSLECFNYHIEVYEKDWVKYSDDLLTNQTMVTSLRPHTYQVDAQDTSDGLDLLRKFEIYMLVIHNCTSKGNMKTFKYDWGKFNIDEWEVTKSEDLELFDEGEDV